jgi:putative aminopeptidase FrvX
VQVRICLFIALLIAVHAPGRAGELSADLLASWIAADAPTGHEYHALWALGEALPGWSIGRGGNLLKIVGEGEPATLVACPMDAPSFTVSQITDEGYLRLHKVGRAPWHPLFTQAHEGQQLRILTRHGPVIGVTALANGHFANLHAHEEHITQPEDLWLDVGAQSAADVTTLGIELLDPVFRQLPAWSFEGWVAGPAASARVGCATVVAAAETGVSAPVGRTVYALTTQSAFGLLGLSAAAGEVGAADRVILLGSTQLADSPRLREALGNNGPLDPERITGLAPAARDLGALMERVHINDVGEFVASFLDELGAAPTPLDWVPGPTRAEALNGGFAPADAKGRERLDAVLTRLQALGELYGVSGHEGPVRAAVMEALPAWARRQIESDAMGNLWLDLGPRDQPATVFIAHLDEVGWRVTDISGDGVVSLERAGGALALAREGQPAILHVDGASGRESAVAPEQLRGVFLTRATPGHRHPDGVQAWFGLDGSGLRARGVAVGMPVTGYKEGQRLANGRFTVRGMDDRVGTTALLEAVDAIDPQALTQRVVIAWSVQEEIGLRGARALAARLAEGARRVYSIDTFVTSDTPLEAPHFAYAPLGNGPVLRSMESSGLVTRRELDGNRSIAAAAGIGVQIGMTQGGTDGTAFTYYGVPNAGLSWPGRYSHGPAELGDGRDIVGLIDLILAFVRAGRSP